ncbi:phospholipase D [Capronia coronata CBS 617.96]|uniref:Phospholipase D1 n=1 Tax=Capronia coronata CBS 617.96 TaxID=1182541 RepID=W9Z1X7_9EURO|nr:phospholipase D [Capronia coronata CBS 617.96]EXJ95576.1 phospholipase D [Capronia coronata CBS 617.96]
MAEPAETSRTPPNLDLETEDERLGSVHNETTLPRLILNGGPGPAVDMTEQSDGQLKAGLTPPSATPRESSPDRNPPFSPTSKMAGVLKRAFPPTAQTTNTGTNDQSSWATEPGESDSAVNANGTPTAGRKSVQFSRDTQEIDALTNGQSTPPAGKDEPSEQDKPQSLYARLRALATSQGFAHARSPSSLSLGGRSTDGKELDGFLSGQASRNEAGLSATLEEDSGAEADADAEESATENPMMQSSPRKRRRRGRRFDAVETAPSSPHSPMRHGSSSLVPGLGEEADRPHLMPRRATDTDMARQGLSEDEGRKQLAGAGASGWTRRHPLRGLSSGGQRRPGDTTPDGQRRPLTLLGFSNANSSREVASGDAQTPKTPSRRKLMAERGSTLSAAKWRQLKNSLRMLGQSKKKERTPDHEKSAELLAELAAGTPAALMVASMFQRDEHDHRRIPVLLEQLKLQITDSEVDKSRESDATQADRHLVFRIELEYGNGINRMNWVVKRSLRDFVNLHLKYKLHYSSEKLLGRGDASKQMPKFPKSAFPYLKSFRGFDEEDEDEEDDLANDNDPGTATDSERPMPRFLHRSSFTPGRRKSSAAGVPDTPGGGRRDIRFAERQRKKLETYIHKMTMFLLFRPESNRLCKFLEVSALGMRLAAEGSYHGKEGFLLIRSAKGLDFRKALTPHNFTHRHAPKWFLVRHSYVVCIDSPEEMHIYDVFLFDSDFRIQSTKVRPGEQRGAKELAEAARESAKHPQHHRLKLVNSERRLKLLARNERQLHQFEESIRLMLQISPWVKEHRFESFAPIRPNCFAQWLVDGRDHMWLVSRALEHARDVIYIHDWWLSPELYMRRPPQVAQKWRLDRILKRKAEEGVKIFVIVYRNIESAVPIDSQYTKFSLLDLHPNIFVQRSPNQFRQNTFFWAHHEKLCIVDHTLAFVGGIDLCFGRWDTPQHTLVDDKPTGFEPDSGPKDAQHNQLWPGKDYSNPRVQDFVALNKPYEEMYDRLQVPRMPWHDISMHVVGQPARDLTRHFVQRWNYILRQRKPTRPTPFLLPPPDFNPAELEALGLDGTCEVQILRSAGPWSIGTPDKTEHSIMNAYVKLIEESEHFVYIENQFFISSCETEGATVHNKINDALVERITRAAKNDEAWRAVIVIPLMPGFQNTVEQEGGTSVRLIMQYQYRSICRGESSLFGRLKSVGIEPEDYIQFYSLRQWGRIGKKKSLVTEQLYIHAKCMVVDDRAVIIGSANINERSMLGNRDSECAAVVRDTDMVWSRMNGKPYQVGRFPHTLRMRLMREHLGLDVDSITEETLAMNAERDKARKAGKAARPKPPDDEVSNSEFGEMDDVVDSHDERARELREELLHRVENLKSFNHDVDWEQEGNPNLKSGRKLTEDARVTGNAQHKQDVEGHGFDKMADVEAAGLGGARDTTLVNGGKEVLISAIEPEGHTTLQNPRKRGDEKRLPSYVVSLEAPNPPLPPRPSVERMNTERLGLPLVSQLPALPQLDDSDIGGPPLAKSASRDPANAHHPLVNELKRPLVDRDCMTDPVHDAFLYDTWHAVAENNTKIYRNVFRCMPDNQVRNWDDYHQYVAYQQRFNQQQGTDVPQEEKVSHPARSASASKSGPPGAGIHAPAAQLKALTQIPGDLEKGTTDIKDKVKGAFGADTKAEKVDAEKAQLRTWATGANEAQAEREEMPTLHRQETLTEEKAGLPTVPEGPTVGEEGSGEGEDDDDSTEPTDSAPSTATAVEKEKSTTANGSPPTAAAPFVGYSDAINQNSAQAAAVPGGGAPAVRRRRRGTTRSGRREFNASDDILSTEEAEELLNCVQGHLVVWPYDW